MNQVNYAHVDTGLKATELSSWMLSHGVTSMTTDEVSELLGIVPSQVRQRLAAQRKAGAIVSPARGFWVPVPAERATWGAPEPGAYIDDMMGHLGCGYYIGWLSAATLYGAAHQAVQEFQVATSKPVSDREVGRSRLRFLTRPRIASVPVSRIAVSSSLALVSTVGATMLDVAEDIDVVGGLDNAATVIAELAWGGEVFMGDVLSCSDVHSAVALRRLGWILENIAEVDGLEDLARISEERGGAPSYLSPTAARAGRLDARWNILLNKEVDSDI